MRERGSVDSWRRVRLLDEPGKDDDDDLAGFHNGERSSAVFSEIECPSVRNLFCGALGLETCVMDRNVKEMRERYVKMDCVREAAPR